jgi:serine/threonine protein phosphatase PrpC
MRISRATARGLRDYQEDRFVVSSMPDGKLIAVMDGHGGAYVSSLIARTLRTLWKKQSAATLHETIQQVFQSINTVTCNMDEGSTFSLVFIPLAAGDSGERVITIAVLGDSPVIVINDEGEVDVSPMHNARSNPDELLAARARGASFDGNYIFEHWGSHGLQMTRAMGDRDLGGIISREPEIYDRTVGPDSVVLVGTDGLFDPHHRNMAPAIADVVEKIKAGMTAKALVDCAVNLPTNDNVTAIIVRFGNKKSRRKKSEKTAYVGGLPPGQAVRYTPPEGQLPEPTPCHFCNDTGWRPTLEPMGAFLKEDHTVKEPCTCAAGKAIRNARA